MALLCSLEGEDRGSERPVTCWAHTVEWGASREPGISPPAHSPEACRYPAHPIRRPEGAFSVAVSTRPPRGLEACERWAAGAGARLGGQEASHV